MAQVRRVAAMQQLWVLAETADAALHVRRCERSEECVECVGKGKHRGNVTRALNILPFIHSVFSWRLQIFVIHLTSISMEVKHRKRFLFLLGFIIFTFQGCWCGDRNKKGILTTSWLLSVMQKYVLSLFLLSPSSSRS